MYNLMLSLYDISHNKTATQTFSQFSVSFICLNTYNKNPLLSDLWKSAFWTEF